MQMIPLDCTSVTLPLCWHYEKKVSLVSRVTAVPLRTAFYYRRKKSRLQLCKFLIEIQIAVVSVYFISLRIWNRVALYHWQSKICNRLYELTDRHLTLCLFDTARTFHFEKCYPERCKFRFFTSVFYYSPS